MFKESYLEHWLDCIVQTATNSALSLITIEKQETLVTSSELGYSLFQV